MAFPCRRRPSSTSTSTPSTRSSTGRAASPSWPRARPSSRCRRSRSPTTARSPARSSSTARPGSTGVKPILGCEVYVARRPPGAAEGLRAPDAPGRVERGLREPDQARLGRLPRGLLLQAARRLGAPERALERPDRALGLPLRSRLQGARERADRREAERELARLRDIFGPTRRIWRSRTPASISRRGSTTSLPRLSKPTGLPLVATGDVHYLRHEDAQAHEALLCIQSGDSLANPNHWRFDTDQFYFKTPRRDGAGLRRLPRGGARGRSRSPSAATSRSSSAVILLPHFPTPDGRDAFDYLVELCEKGLRKRYGKVDAGAPGAAQVRAEDDPRDGLRGLLPDRLGLHPLREDERDRRRAGPRLGGRLARRLLPRDHRHRPDPVRPPLRALPEPGAQVDAGHRHRLLGARARPGHQLRVREVRARPRRPDHHLRDDDGARRRARRRPRARHPLRHGRPDRQAHPRGPEGLPRRLPEAGRRAQAGLRRGRDRAPDRRPGEAARGARAPGLDPRRRASSSATARSPTTCRSSRRAPTRRSSRSSRWATSRRSGS